MLYAEYEQDDGEMYDRNATEYDEDADGQDINVGNDDDVDKKCDGYDEHDGTDVVYGIGWDIDHDVVDYE